MKLTKKDLDALEAVKNASDYWQPDKEIDHGKMIIDKLVRFASRRVKK